MGQHALMSDAGGYAGLAMQAFSISYAVRPTIVERAYLVFALPRHEPEDRADHQTCAEAAEQETDQWPVVVRMRGSVVP